MLFNRQKILAEILSHLADHEETKANAFAFGGVPNLASGNPINAGDPMQGIGGDNPIGSNPFTGTNMQPLVSQGVGAGSGAGSPINYGVGENPELGKATDYAGGLDNKVGAGWHDVLQGKNPLNGADLHGHGGGILGGGSGGGAGSLDFDKFHADNPNSSNTTTNTDFGPMMATGTSGVLAGQDTLANAGGDQASLFKTLSDTGEGSILGNQGKVFNTLGTIGADQSSTAGDIKGLASALTGTTGFSGQQAGVGNQIGGLAGQGPNGLGGVLGQQQSLGQTLLDQSNGKGPNPAQLQYQQNVNQNIANAAGTIASQKGISPALAARMIAQGQGAGAQGAAGGAAVLQAQQQLAAQNALGNNLLGQGQTIQGQGSLLGQQVNALGAAGTTQATGAGILGQSVGAQGAAAQTAGQQGTNLTQQVGTLGQAGTAASGLGTIGANQAGQGNTTLSTGVGGQTAQNNTITAGSLGSQGLNAGVAGINAINTANMAGSAINGGAGALGSILGGGGAPDPTNLATRGTNQAQPNFVGPPAAWKGGVVPHYAGGGLLEDAQGQSAAFTNDVLNQILKNPKQAPDNSSQGQVNPQNNPWNSYQKAADAPVKHYAGGGDILGMAENQSANSSDNALMSILKNPMETPSYGGPIQAKGNGGGGGGGVNPGMGLQIAKMFSGAAPAAGTIPSETGLAGAGGVLGEGAGGAAGAGEAWAGADAAAGATATEAAPYAAEAVVYKGGKIGDVAKKRPLVKQSSAEVAAQANPSLAQMLMAQGGPVPGKAKFPGNNIKNDTVPSVLSADEIVLPRSVTMAPNAPDMAREFVQKLKAKTSPTYGKVLEAKRKLDEAVARHKCGGGKV